MAKFKISCYSIQILTALRGTVKIIGPKWCQNHNYARSEAEGIVMVLTSPRAYNFKLCPPPHKKQSIFVLYTEWKKKNAKFEGIFHFDRLFTKLIIINANGVGSCSLRLLRNYRAKTMTRASMWFWREEHNTRPTPIDYAPGIVIFSGHS